MYNIFYFSTFDDPYIVYGAMQSGQHTMIVTRDQFRNHTDLLGPEERKVFREWQRHHQIRPQDDFEYYTKTGVLPSIKVIFCCNIYTPNSYLFSLTVG